MTALPAKRAVSDRLERKIGNSRAAERASASGGDERQTHTQDRRRLCANVAYPMPAGSRLPAFVELNEGRRRCSVHVQPRGVRLDTHSTSVQIHLSRFPPHPLGRFARTAKAIVTEGLTEFNKLVSIYRTKA